MRNYVELLKNKIFIFILFIGIILFGGGVEAFADELSFAVSPSKIVDYRIEPGQSKDIVFSVGNKSIFPADQTEKKELYKFKIEVSAVLEDSEGIEMDTTNIVKFNKTILECKPSEMDKTTLSINIPKDFEKNAYKLYIKFTRQPVSGIEDTQNKTYSVIKVPIYLFVGNEDEFNKLKSDYEVTKFYMDFGQDNKTFTNRIFDNLKELISLNPLKVIDTFKDIKHKPVYTIIKNKDKSDETIVADVNNNLMVNINDVVTDSKGTNWKYVLASNSQLSQNVNNVLFNDNSVEFVLDNEDVIVVEGTTKTINFIKNQINNILNSINGTPVLSDLFSKIKVPINKNYDILDYSAFVEIKNTGEKDVHVASEVSLIKDNASDIGVGILKPLTIPLGNTETINIPITVDGALTTGDYRFNANFLAGKINKTTNYNYQIDTQLSEKIFFTTLITYCLLILMLIVIIKIIISSFTKYKKGYVKKVNLRDLTEEELIKVTSVPKNNNKLFMAVISEELNVRNKSNNSAKIIDVILKDFIVEIDKEAKTKTDWLKVKYLISEKKKFNKK